MAVRSALGTHANGFAEEKRQAKLACKRAFEALGDDESSMQETNSDSILDQV